MALKWALGILAAGNIVFFNLWMNEKEKRIAQEVHFSAVESERKIKDDKSVITQKKIAVRREKCAEPQPQDCDCLNYAISADVVKWLRS